LLRVVRFEESGFRFEMIIPWKEALSIATVAVCVATIAGLAPALHAMRLRITAPVVASSEKCPLLVLFVWSN
jgi:hypothetical protein